MLRRVISTSGRRRIRIRRGIPCHEHRYFSSPSVCGACHDANALSKRYDENDDETSLTSSLSCTERTPLNKGMTPLTIYFPNHHHFHFPHHHHQPHLYQATQTRTFAVFVSRHNSLNVSSSQIIQVCTHHGMSPNEDIRTTSTHVIIKECPFCHDTRGKMDNMFKLYVKIGAGAYFCHRCGSKGSWYDFKMKLGGYDVVDTSGRNQVGAAPRLRQQQHADMGGDITSSWSNPQTDTWSNNNNNNTSAARAASNASSILPMPSERLAAAYITNLLDHQQEKNDALSYLLNQRQLNTSTLRKYGVGRAIYSFPSGKKGGYESKECVTFPWIMRATEVAEQESLRGAFYDWQDEVQTQQQQLDSVTEEKEGESEDSTTRKKDENKEKEKKKTISERDKLLLEKGPWKTRRIKARSLTNKSQQRLDPPGGGWGLFGWHTVPDDATSVVITEGEYDAMAVYQATGRPAVSLPNGCRNLPVQVLPMLEKFDKIYLWMDNDGPGQEGAEQFAKKIGINRCYIVQPTSNDCIDENTPLPKDANDALRLGFDLNQMIENSKVVPHERILSFGELRSQVLHEITNPEKYVGVPMLSLPTFTSIVKGFRRGEMTVLTGPTGSGKTTFLGQLSLDLAEQGVNTLWGSFEIKNTRLIHKLLQQFSRRPLPMGETNQASYLEALADRFESLPLYFMTFHGGSEVDDVLDAMEYAAYVHDVEHIILDNMQFMITRNNLGGGRWGGGGGNSFFDKFDMQDIAIEKFRKFATERNIHLTLVVHPRKEDEGAKLGISSVYGSAKATQEADTVLILQKEGTRKYLDVRKNRFDGTLGNCPLFFQRKSGRFAEQLEVGKTAMKAKTETPKNNKSTFTSSSSSSSGSISEKKESVSNVEPKRSYPRTSYDDILDQYPREDK